MGKLALPFSLPKKLPAGHEHLLRLRRSRIQEARRDFTPKFQRVLLQRGIPVKTSTWYGSRWSCVARRSRDGPYARDPGRPRMPLGAQDVEDSNVVLSVHASSFAVGEVPAAIAARRRSCSLRSTLMPGSRDAGCRVGVRRRSSRTNSGSSGPRPQRRVESCRRGGLERSERSHRLRLVGLGAKTLHTSRRAPTRHRRAPLSAARPRRSYRSVRVKLLMLAQRTPGAFRLPVDAGVRCRREAHAGNDP